MWIAKSDLVELGVSETTLYRKSGEWTSRRAIRTGSIGQPSKEYLLSSLPPDLQARWHKLDEERRASAATEAAALQADSATDNADERLAALQAALARFSPPQYTLDQRQAVENRCIELARLCDEAAALILKLKRAGQGITVHSPGCKQAGLNRAYHPEMVALAGRAASFDPVYVAMYPSSKLPPSTSTFLRFVKQYQASGPVAFIRQTQTLAPELDERFKEVPIEAINWLQRNFKSYAKASLTSFGEKWLEWCSRNKIKMPFTTYWPGKKGSCYSWLYRWRQKVPATSVTLATKGERGFEAIYGYIIRDYSELRPRDGWTMDWRQFDVCLWVPARKGGGVARLARYWLCPVLDLASVAPFGFAVQDRPNARGITLAYVDAISRSPWKSEPGLELLCGMQRTRETSNPAFLHFDNGKDYRSKTVEGHSISIPRFDVESGLVATIDTYRVGLAADVSVRVRHAKVLNAKSKIVEPWFRYAIANWEKTLPGYCGNKPAEKPHYFAAALRLHAAFTKRRDGKPADLRELPPLWVETFERNKERYGVGTPFLSEQEFKAVFTERMLTVLRTPHSRLRDDLGDMTPVEYINLYADSPHMMTEQATAALLLIPRVVTVSRAEIAVSWEGEEVVYREVPSDISDGTALARLPEKTKVEFRFNPDNLGRALVMANGAMLCWVEAPALVGWNATSEDFKRAKEHKKRIHDAAQEFFAPPTTWREAAIDRQQDSNVTPLRAVVNGPYIEEQLPVADVMVPTRFDRKQGGATKLRAVESDAGIGAGVDDWSPIQGAFEGNPQKDDDDWKEPWEG